MAMRLIDGFKAHRALDERFIAKGHQAEVIGHRLQRVNGLRSLIEQQKANGADDSDTRRNRALLAIQERLLALAEHK